MTELARAIALSGAIDVDMLRELTKWRLPVEVPSDELYESPEEAIEAIENALASSNQVEIRTTDLDILRQFLRTKRKGKLCLVSSLERGTFDLEFGVTTTGDYIIPWRSESVEDMMTNGESHIIDGRRKVFVSRVQELFFGESKVFILCTPIRSKETHVTTALES